MMVKQRLEQENKSTEMVQYIKMMDENWDRDVKWDWSARRLKQNNEDRNVVGDLRGHLGVSESNDNALEVLGVSQSSGEWLA